MNKTSRQLFEEYYSVHSEAYADFTQSADGRYYEWEVQHGWRSWQGGYAGVDAAKAELISLIQSVVNVTATWSDPHLSHVALDRSMKSLEEILNKLAEKCIDQNSPAKDHIRALADQIITDYKQHYDFPPQGESHMRDCITDDLRQFELSQPFNDGFCTDKKVQFLLGTGASLVGAVLRQGDQHAIIINGNVYWQPADKNEPNQA